MPAQTTGPPLKRGAVTPKKNGKKPKVVSTSTGGMQNNKHKRTKQPQVSDCGKRKHNKCASEINKDKKAKPNKNSIKKVTLKVV
jgi:hypothetical protein